MKNTNQLKQEIKTFLLEKECYATYNHCITVGDYAEEIGHEFLSAIYPNNERIFVAEDMKIELFKEERQFPLIIHQKILRIMAKENLVSKTKKFFQQFLAILP